ncbi:hypothetical protein CEXT_345731 [Caerostris extrusa]|uniref:Uncharacterized protein n=1 Tax=Caerostris extrusa TaxID=172846 RepID=A0AAV4UY10_CAEEX|nr:hypothetical protein CEXT_345731 [Caerostris extrusa]
MSVVGCEIGRRQDKIWPDILGSGIGWDCVRIPLKLNLMVFGLGSRWPDQYTLFNNKINSDIINFKDKTKATLSVMERDTLLQHSTIVNYLSNHPSIHPNFLELQNRIPTMTPSRKQTSCTRERGKEMEKKPQKVPLPISSIPGQNWRGQTSRIFDREQKVPFPEFLERKREALLGPFHQLFRDPWDASRSERCDCSAVVIGFNRIQPTKVEQCGISIWY